MQTDDRACSAEQWVRDEARREPQDEPAQRDERQREPKEQSLPEPREAQEHRQDEPERSAEPRGAQEQWELQEQTDAREAAQVLRDGVRKEARERQGQPDEQVREAEEVCS